MDLAKLSGKSLEAIWGESLHKSLNLNLWESNFIYDAGHFLMVPMHGAFCSGNRLQIQEFENHFKRFLDSYKDDPTVNDKARLQYFYLLSQFAYLSLSQDKNSKIGNDALIFLEKQILLYWTIHPAWHWSENKFLGMKSRIDYKLNFHSGLNCPKHYGFIFDDEKYLFAIAADIRTCLKLGDKEPNSQINEILDYAYRVYFARVVFTKGDKWLMQPGYLSDHGDYSYTGYIKEKRYAEKRPKPNQAEDSSHSLRYPLWLLSLERAFRNSSPSKAFFFRRMHKGLGEVFVQDILAKPNRKSKSYRLANFMDGSNGLYSWKNDLDPTKHSGFGQYGLSFSLNIGWWIFLDRPEVVKAYSEIGKNWEKAYVKQVNVDQIFLTQELLVLINKSAILASHCKHY
jgi:hypothetical protein